ncbi:MAG: hypothetical protein BroJett033_5260 [Chloroflexota bacterium]|nr:MAG: hypothetical protein BroJett033_5260 [Chloroflexota bacterium]
MPRRAARPIWISALALLIGAASLVARWPERGLWYDETVNAYFASQSWSDLWKWTARIDNQVPLHFALLKLWASAAGTSEFALRAFSALCALLLLAGLIALGHRAGGRIAAGWWAALAFIPAQSFVYAAFEVRPYALALALFAWSSALLWGLWTRCGARAGPLERSCGALFAAALLTALALLYTHYTGALALAALASYFGWRALRAPSRRRIALLALWGGGLAIGFLPWVAALAGRDIRAGTAYAGHIPPADALRTYVEFFAYGQNTLAEADPPRYAWAIAALVAASIPLWWAGYPRSERAWKRALFAVLALLVPLVTLLVMVYGVQGKLSGRHAWPAWLGAALLLGLGLDALRRLGPLSWLARAAFVGVIALPATANLHPLYNSYLREAFATIEQQAAPGDVLILRDGTLFTAASYYRATLPWLGLPPEPITDVNRFLFLPEVLDELAPFLGENNARRAWMLSWQGHIMDPQNLTAGLLELIGARQPVARGFGDVSLALYTLHAAPNAVSERVQALEPLAEAPGGGPTLLGGYLLNPDPIQRGAPLLIHTWWERGAQVVPGLRVSVRLYGADGQFYAQWDQPPVSPTFGQELWPPGVPVLSRFDQLAVPADMPPGPAEIRLMIYDTGGAFEPFSVTLAALAVQE